jgi:two-component system chemotaxis response regulator CheB
MRDVRVVVVDRSATVRQVLRRILGSAAGIAVVGEAADGEQALRQVGDLRPDAVLLDLDLPNVDGITVAAAIMRDRPTPIVATASRVRLESVRKELLGGGIGVFPKPEVPEEWEELGRVLPETILQVGSLAVPSEPVRVAVEVPRPELEHHLVYLAIGASTGGPGALRQLLLQLGPRFRVGVAVVQHLAEGFEHGLADWLGTELGVDVQVARHGEVLVPGTVRLAESGSHLRIETGGVLYLDRETQPIRGHRPSANVLFWSLRDLCPTNVAAVLLTGMGDDGVDGLLALRQAGALTVTQDEPSCAVFGMPKAALARGAAELALPPSEIGRLLATAIDGRPR